MVFCGVLYYGTIIVRACILALVHSKDKWAASWQNQQCGCLPREYSVQPGHPPSLIRVLAVRLMGS